MLSVFQRVHFHFPPLRVVKLSNSLQNWEIRKVVPSVLLQIHGQLFRLTTQTITFPCVLRHSSGDLNTCWNVTTAEVNILTDAQPIFSSVHYHLPFPFLPKITQDLQPVWYRYSCTEISQNNPINYVRIEEKPPFSS